MKTLALLVLAIFAFPFTILAQQDLGLMEFQLKIDQADLLFKPIEIQLDFVPQSLDNNPIFGIKMDDNESPADFGFVIEAVESPGGIPVFHLPPNLVVVTDGNNFVNPGVEETEVTSAPEPTSVLLLCSAGFLCLFRRKRNE